MKKFPKLETASLILNCPEQDDTPKIAAILNDEIYSKNTINIPFPYTAENAEFWISLAKESFESNSQYIFAIRLKENPEIIGGIDLGIDKTFNKAELGYWVAKEYWNKGIATEAGKEVIKFGFENLNLKRIFATHFDFNESSGRVMEKMGMKKEGVLRSHTFKNGEYQNHLIYAIINEKL